MNKTSLKGAFEIVYIFMSIMIDNGIYDFS